MSTHNAEQLKAKVVISKETIKRSITQFNRNIILMTKKLSDHYPNDPVADRVKKRIKLATDFVSSYTIELAGPYLFKFKDKIYAMNDGTYNFFLNYNFDTEIKKVETKSVAESVIHIIQLLKSLFVRLDAQSKQDYSALVISLLDDYVDYAIAKAEVEEVKNIIKDIKK